jgi:glycosyltransferase involved in cell wall biosynthesis
MVDNSVVICALSERRWQELEAAIGSVRRQTRPTRKVTVVIDQNEELLARARSAWPDVSVVPNEHRRGLSGARNTGASIAHGDVVALLDDDAQADQRWRERLAAAYEDSRILAVGGAGGYARGPRPRTGVVPTASDDR